MSRRLRRRRRGTASTWDGDNMVMRLRQQSALPALCAHIIVKHPDSDVADEIKAYAATPRPAAPLPNIEAIADMAGAALRSLRDSEEREALSRVGELLRRDGRAGLR